MAKFRGKAMVDREERPGYARQLLEEMNIVPTEWRVNFFVEWMRWENTRARHNPLATTRVVEKNEYWQDKPLFNDNGGVPVKNYNTREIGVRATVETLSLSYYLDVLKALNAQKINNRKKLANELANIWGTTGFGRVIREGWSPAGAKGTPEGANAGEFKSIKPITARTVKKSLRDGALANAVAIPVATTVAVNQNNDGIVGGDLTAHLDLLDSIVKDPEPEKIIGVLIMVLSGFVIPMLHRVQREMRGVSE